jgi:hypothetical protein
MQWKLILTGAVTLIVTLGSACYITAMTWGLFNAAGGVPVLTKLLAALAVAVSWGGLYWIYRPAGPKDYLLRTLAVVVAAWALTLLGLYLLVASA